MKRSNLCFVLITVLFLIILGCATVPKTPLIQASSIGDLLTVQNLIKEGANINESDRDGYTPLMHAIWERKIDVAKYLIQSGADIKLKDKGGSDALLYAVNYGQIELVNILLDRGANIETKDASEATPLNCAVSTGHYDLTRLLLDRGANIETRDWLGLTPLLNAIKSSVSNEIIDLLIKRGANLNAKDNEGYTPLEWALFYKKTDLASKLQQAMVDARKDMPNSRIVFIRESNVLIPGELQNVSIYMNEKIVANLGRNSTSYIDVDPGKCTMVIKGSKLEGNHVKTFEALVGQTHYFLVAKRLGSTVAGLIGGALAQGIESQSLAENAGPFNITQLEESVAKEKIKALLSKKK